MVVFPLSVFQGCNISGKNRETLEGAEDSSHPDGGGEGKWGLDGNNDPRHGSFFDIDFYGKCR